MGKSDAWFGLERHLAHLITRPARADNPRASGDSSVPRQAVDRDVRATVRPEAPGKLTALQRVRDPR